MEAYMLKPFGIQGEHGRSKTAYEQTGFALPQIHEEDEWSSSCTTSKAFTPVPSIAKKQFMRKHCDVFNLPTILSGNPQIAFLQQFLLKLRKSNEVFESFLQKATNLNLINISQVGSSEYYYKYIHFSNNSKLSRPCKTAQTNLAIATPRSKSVASSSIQSDSFDHPDHAAPALDSKLNMLHYLQYSTLQPAKERVFRPKSRKRKTIIPKRKVLNRAKPKMIQLFQNMCGMSNSNLKSCRLTNYLFKLFLQKKFPNEMAEAMNKYFDFKSANFEDFCVEMDRFICAGDEKHYAMCFDCFDFNKDRYICYQDTYTAIELRKEDIYDSDLIKIRKMFEMKKRGMVPAKRSESRRGGRRTSIMSLASDLSSYLDDGEQKKVPNVHPEKPEAIVLDEFTRIDFKGKPELLRHFFLHTCNYDIESCKEVTTPVVKSRRQSEEIIFESKLEDGVLCLPDDDVKSKYYIELDVAMNLFHIAQTNELLKKFEFLRDKSNDDFKTISIPSMIEHWPKLFGGRSDYVSERFYYFFAGPQNYDVTKIRFLSMIFEAGLSELSQKMFSFGIYDSRNDLKITPDEIYKMEQSFPQDSAFHRESMVIANEFIASIFGRKRKPVPFIEFAYFNELVPDSLFYKEFVRFVQTPLDELMKTRNGLFDVILEIV